MYLLYLMLFLNRFHNDPRVGSVLFQLGPLVVTPVKIVGLSVVLFAIVARRHSNEPGQRSDFLSVLFLAFCTIPIIEVLALQLPSPAESISSLISLALLLIAMRLLVTSEDRMVTTIRVLIMISAFASLWVYKEHFLQHSTNPAGLEQDSNYEALTLVTGIPLATWLAGNEIGTLWRRLGLVCAMLMGVAVVLTESRAGLIAAAIMALSAIVYSHRKALTIGAVAMVATLIVLFPPAGLLERFQSIKLTGEATNGAENSTRTHVELARAGWNMVLAHPLVGIGLDRFKSVAPNYNPDLLSTAGRSYIAHDTYVQIAAETGVFRLLLFLAIVGLAIYNCRGARKSTNERVAALGLAMQLALIAFCVAAASVTAQYVVTFWMILFLSHNLRTIAELARPQSAVKPGRARVTGEVYRSRAYFDRRLTYRACTPSVPQIQSVRLTSRQMREKP